MLTVIQILQVLLDLVWWIVIADFVLSILIAFNVVNTYNGFVRSLYDGIERLCQPLYRPIRRILPNTGAIDFSPMVVLVLIGILSIILNRLALNMAYGMPM
ncbi:YggT family protein [Sphingomonas koreensis]|nr:YggT family protein [Sphingomonas koreensis]